MASLRTTLGRTIARIAPDWSLMRSQAREFRALGRTDGLQWRPLPPMRLRRFEAAIASAGETILIVAGYGDGLDEVLHQIDRFDLRRERWIEPIAMPTGSASTHLGCTCVGDRWLFLAGGQVGPQCRPATDQVWSLDLARHEWHALPALPEVRYAPILLHARGRLHAIGGTGPERPRSRSEHWSLAIRDGRATEATWQEEPPIPLAGTHRGGGVIDEDLLVFGGQAGDARAIPDDPAFTCDLRDMGGPSFGDSFRFRIAEGVWSRLAPMPHPVSHSDTSVTIHRRRAIVVGGISEANVCGDLIQGYDPDEDRWSLLGRLPRPMKNSAAIAAGDAIHLFGGQRSVSANDLRPHRIVRDVWRASIDSWSPPISLRG